jgi:hypothetical protein
LFVVSNSLRLSQTPPQATSTAAPRSDVEDLPATNAPLDSVLPVSP